MVREFLQRHLFTCTAIAVIALALATVEQFHNLFELPPLELLFGSATSTLLLAILLGLAAIYVGLAVWITWDRSEGGAARDAGSTAATASPPRLGGRRSSYWWGLACLSAGAAMWLFGPETPILGVVERTITLSASYFLVAWGGWLMARGRFHDGPLIRMFFRLLVSLCVVTAIGELFWIGAHQFPQTLSFRNYSVWAILYACFCLLMIARVIDALQQQISLPVRALVVTGLIIVAGTRGATDVGAPRTYASLSSETKVASLSSAHAVAAGNTPAGDANDSSPGVEELVESQWLSEFRRRLTSSIPQDDPVVLIAASGGGSRAALFTALLLNDFSQRPVGDYHVASHTLMISSVSGGTLASTVHVDRLRRNVQAAVREVPHNFVVDEVLLRMEQDARNFRDWLPEAKADAYGEKGAEYIESVWLECQKRQLQSFHRSEYVDDMCMDFMAPLLRGMLLPGVERGEAVQRFWERKFGLTRTNLQDLAGPAEGESSAPYLLCNTTSIHQGELVLLDFPPLPHDLFAGRRARRRGFPCTAVINLDPQQNSIAEIRLSEAARMSANFPWGFASAHLRVSEQREADLRLIDGGVFDNSGIAALRFVLDRLSEWEQEYLAETARGPIPTSPGEAPAEVEPAYRMAHELLDQLRRRGVILIEIDSGKKPERPSGIAAALPALFDPTTALENSGYAQAEYNGREHVDRIEEILTGHAARLQQDRLKRLGALAEHDPKTVELVNMLRLKALHHLQITCNHEENVMTAWALGPTDKAKVFVRFMIGIQGLRDDLREALDALRECREYSQLLADVEQAQVELSREELTKLVQRGSELSEKGRVLQVVRNNTHTSQSYVFRQAAQKKLDFRKEAVGLNLEPPAPNPLIARTSAPQRIELTPPTPVDEPPPLPSPAASRPTPTDAAETPERGDEVKQFLQQVDGRANEAYESVRERVLRKLPNTAPSKRVRSRE